MSIVDVQEEVDNVTRLLDQIGMFIVIIDIYIIFAADRDMSLFQLYYSQMQTFIYNCVLTNTRLTLILTIITASIVGISIGHYIGKIILYAIYIRDQSWDRDGITRDLKSRIAKTGFQSGL